MKINASINTEEDFLHILLISDRSDSQSITINLKKCVSDPYTTGYLDHVMDATEISPFPNKILALNNYPSHQ